MPWCISFLIALPLVIFTVYASRCLLCKTNPNYSGNNYLPKEGGEDTSDDESEDPQDFHSLNSSEDEFDIENT